jgi:hypothetical protein
VAKTTAKRVTRGAAEALTSAFKKVGLKAAAESVAGFFRRGIKMGCAGACETWLAKFSKRYSPDYTMDLLKKTNKMSDDMVRQLDGVMKRANHWFPPYRLGAKTELDRLLHYFDADNLAQIQPRFWDDAAKRWYNPDGLLNDGGFLEVKRWSERYLKKHIPDLRERMIAYVNQYEGGVLEIVSKNGYGADTIADLCKAVPSGVTVRILTSTEGVGSLPCL